MAKQKAPQKPTHSQPQKITKKKRPDTVYCERCGEDYSVTYRRCPFCDERPGRRVDDHRTPLQLAVLIISLVLILAAAFIVFTKVAPLLTSRNPAPPVEPETPGVEDPFTPVTPDLPSQPETPTPGTEEPPVTSAIPANAIVLSREDFTLVPGEKYTLLATVSPANTTDPVVWSCDRPDLLTVNQDGSVVNNNRTGQKIAVTVTATAGGVSAKCIVRCNSSMDIVPPATSDGGNTGTSSGTSTGTGSSGAAISGKTQGKVVGAANGLNVRSGPGSNYEKIASIQNGNSVTILENTGTGWYKIDYGGGKIGYASVDYIQAK